MRLPRALALLSFLGLAVPVFTQTASDQGAIALTRATVIDVKEGKAAADVAMIVRGNRITAVGRTATVRIPTDARVIDATGKYVIPGLWDMHAHLEQLQAATEIDMPLLVANGVTGIREPSADCMTTPDCLSRRRTWQQQIERGEIVGPRLLAIGGWAANGPRGLPKGVPEFFGTANAEQARQLVRYFKERNVDFVKVYGNIPAEAFFAYADEARKLGLVLMGHEPMIVSAIDASNAGMKSFEHARVFLFNCFAGAAEFRSVIEKSGWNGPNTLWRRRMVDEYDPAICQEVFRTFVRNKTAYVPTHLTRKMDAFADNPDYRQDPRSKYVTTAAWKNWNDDADGMARGDGTAEGRKSYMDFYRKGLDITRQAYRAGVQVMLGTDSGDSYVFPGFAVHDELQELVTAGLTPAEALKAATWNGAEFLGRTSDSGSVEPGKLADLVVLDANPLLAIQNSRKIHAVVLNGKYLDRSALDALLSSAEAAAASR
jgi:amidohydrolase family protein